MERYDKKTIEKARRLYNKNVPLRKICEATGIRSTSTIQFRFDKKYRAAMVERGEKWRKKNPKRWREICRKAREKRHGKK